MSASIEQIASYCADANITFLDSLIWSRGPGKKISGWKTPPHGSGLIFPLKGRALFTTESATFELMPGMMAHIGANTSVDKEVLGDEEWQYAVVHYGLPEDEAARFQLYSEHFSLNFGSNPKISDIVKRIDTTQGEKRPQDRLRTKVLFLSLIEEIVGTMGVLLENDDYELIQEARRIIETRYSEPLSVNILADELGMDRRHFSSLFERHVGVRPQNYLIDYRLKRAMELMEFCACPIRQIAECVGYTDNLYFSKAFKQRTGLTPSKFKERIEHEAKQQQRCGGGCPALGQRGAKIH